MSIPAATLTEFPGPVDRPDGDIVIFDGHCKFCRRQVHRIFRADRSGRLAFVSLHDPLVAQRWPDLSHDQLMSKMTIVDRRGKRHGGAAAFQYLTRRLPRWWVFTPITHFPGFMVIARWVYRQIAKRRYQWGKVEGCDNGSCAVHW
jgi:predicted DCC family thiol-disulfide oxidoreductase YuxK